VLLAEEPQTGYYRLFIADLCCQCVCVCPECGCIEVFRCLLSVLFEMFSLAHVIVFEARSANDVVVCCCFYMCCYCY
jgi:hypothetical protein